MEEPKEVTRYKWEYNNFLEFVKNRKVKRAVFYAKALGIDRRTLLHWMSQPELREALAESIDELVEGMERAGSKDWRMYREMLEILGIDKEQKIDITSDGEKLMPTSIVDLGNIHANQHQTESDSPSN